MRLSLRSLLLGALLMAPVVGASAGAQVLYDNQDRGVTRETRGGSFMIGQRVHFADAQTLSQFGFYGNTETGGLFRFFVFDASNTTMLYDGYTTLAPGSTLGAQMSNVFALAIDANTTINLGFLGDQGTTFNFAWMYPNPDDPAQNGITLPGGNLNYANFNQPTSVGGGAVVSAVRLLGPDVTATPEPASMVLLATGLVGVLALVRRRRQTI